jgi:putative sterol carrier protein
MVKFMTDGWVKEYCKALNNSAAYNKAAETWEGDFIFESDDAGKITRLYIDLWHGKCRKSFQITKEQINPEFVMSGPYANWKLVAQKKLDPIQGLMTGKFKLKGDMAKVMRATKAAIEMVNAIMNVPGTEL